MAAFLAGNNMWAGELAVWRGLLFVLGYLVCEARAASRWPQGPGHARVARGPGRPVQALRTMHVSGSPLQVACVAMAQEYATCCLSWTPCLSGGHTVAKAWARPCSGTSVTRSERRRPWGSVRRCLLPWSKVTQPRVRYRCSGNGDGGHVHSG